MKSLLSILSHVVHGYVGNRATVFPLQYTGWDVDAINTTNYSNHPGYGSLTGVATTPDLVRDIIHGLQQILDLNLSYDIILTGYTPNARVLTVVKDELVRGILGQASRKPHWVVDPVLGDNGKMYVDEKVVPVYKEIFATGLVSLITPNQFEFEVLSGVKIESWDDVKRAIGEFRKDYDVENIVLSSVSINNKLYCVGSTPEETFYVPIKTIDCNFNGCGDLFTALMATSFMLMSIASVPQC
ncbi:putative pyridoxal kinase BUD17 [Candida viswanathii]|uniref:pyridoxal kinase n=1 Tax=Candida viswanathii TaxID=5486 RepID=A0A367XVY0_9ASCO|nr:putative pyridoxal kinase BUD17 [Candida viswanathii]